MHIKDFVKQQRSGHLFQIEGDDLYYRDMAEKYFKELVPEDFKPFNFRNIEVFRSAEELNDVVKQPPMMFDFTVVLVTDHDAQGKGQEAALLALLESVPQNCILAFSAVEFLPKAAASLLESISVQHLMGSELAAEVKQGFAAGIESSAIYKLIEYCGRDMCRIENERVKLEAYSGGKMVRLDDIEQMVVSDPETQIFEFQNLIQRKDKKNAYRVMERLLERGEQPQFLLTMLISQYRRLLYSAISPLSDAELAKVLNVKEYAIKKSREAARAYRPIKLKEIFDRLTSLEFRARKGEMNIKTALDTTVQYLLEG